MLFGVHGHGLCGRSISTVSTFFIYLIFFSGCSRVTDLLSSASFLRDNSQRKVSGPYAELPRVQVDVTMPAVTGSTLNATCATLQAQLNAAANLDLNLTHEIILATGTTCTGPYKLPSHAGGTGWILIKGQNFASLPAPGNRVSLSDAALMPVIKYGEDGGFHVGMFAADTGAQRYRIIGISMVQDSAFSPNWSFVSMGYTAIEALNTGYIILDRVVMQDTDPNHSTHQAVYGNAQLGHTALIDSYVSGIKDVGRVSDTQAWLSTANPGPILIRNNFLRASGENIMLGGGGTPSDAVMPRDVTIQRNTLDKDPAWLPVGSTPGNTLVKTLLELKQGQRVLIEGNDFLNMPWDDGGYVFRLTVRGQGGETWNEVSDLTIRYNLAANVTNFINSFGSDDQSSEITKHSKRWYVHDNLVYGLGWSCTGTCGAFYSIQNGGTGNACTDPYPSCKNEDIIISHNTVDDVGSWVLSVYSAGQVGLIFRDNLINSNGSYGVFGGGASNVTLFGTELLNYAWPGQTWSFTNNRIAGIGGNSLSSSSYPQGTNSYPANATDILWTDRAARNYTLQPSSPAKGAASDGTDQGVDFVKYNAARAGGL